VPKLQRESEVQVEKHVHNVDEPHHYAAELLVQHQAL
jgi:hypothetical protein